MAGAAARRFAAEGAEVFVISIDAAEHADPDNSAVADLSDEAAAVAAFAAARDKLGRLDALFAVAGGSGRRFGDGPLHEVSCPRGKPRCRSTPSTTFLAAREALRFMIDQRPDDDGVRGSIVLMSTVGVRSRPALFATHAYATAKASVIGLRRTTARYYVGHGVRVNALAPATVDTPMAARCRGRRGDPVAYLTASNPWPTG